MDDTEAKAFLASGTRTGKLAVVRADGRPHVSPVWFVLDGDDLVFTTWGDSVKGKALRRDPRVALTVDDESPPYAFVMVEGTVSISEDPDALLHWATVIAARYMGTDQAETYGRRNGVPGELLVHLTPDRIVGRTGVAE